MLGISGKNVLVVTGILFMMLLSTTVMAYENGEIDPLNNAGGSEEIDPEGEAILYLKALADSRVFFEKEIDVSSQEQVYKAALGAEKDSIVFYLGMKDMIPKIGGKARIDAIIKEEMGHIETLSRALIRLKQ